jgi:hypothetical protein
VPGFILPGAPLSRIFKPISPQNVRLIGSRPVHAGCRTLPAEPIRRDSKKPIEHSVYIGRDRLGRYVQTDRRKYKAFDANDRPLGNFRVRASALAAIRKAARSARS